MDRLSAHALWARCPVQHRPELPLLVMVHGVEADTWPVAATALSSLSGGLDDAQTPADVVDCLRHGCSLVNAGVLDLASVRDEAMEVLEELLAWGEAEEERRAAELN